MQHSIYLYIFVLAAIMYVLRVLPLTLLKKPIENQFLQSFLYYVPYVTLAVMTFPAIIEATEVKAAGVAALLVGIFMAWRGQSLIKVATSCCVVVLIVEMLLQL